MARKARPRKRKEYTFAEREAHVEQSEWMRNLRENGLWYLVGAIVVVLAGLAGLLYRFQQAAATREAYTELARAATEEEDPDRLAALADLAEEDTQVRAEALYLKAETAFDLGNYEEAAEAFERVRSEFPESEYVPAAVEGLGFIALERDDLDTALARFEEVESKWPDSFAAMRQPLNIGRVRQQQGNLEAAADAFQRQQDLFPGSFVAMEAQSELAQLRADHPDLFEEEMAEAEAAAEGVVDGGVVTPELSPGEPGDRAPEEAGQAAAEGEAAPSPPDAGEPNPVAMEPENPVAAPAPPESDTPPSPSLDPAAESPLEAPEPEDEPVATGQAGPNGAAGAPVAVTDPTDQPDPTDAPDPTDTPDPTDAPDPTDTADPTDAPDPTGEPDPTDEPRGE